VWVSKHQANHERATKRTYEAKCAFSFAFSAQKHWGKFTPDRLGGYDTTIYVCDGDTVMFGHFSDGDEPRGVIYCREDLFGSWAEHPTPPGRFAAESANLDRLSNRYLYEKYDAPTLEQSGKLYVVQFAQKGRIDKYYVDPAKGFHVVRAEGVESDGYVVIATTKEWTTTSDGLWYVRKYCEESFPIRSIGRYTSWTTTLDSFEPNIDIPDGVFTIDALGLPAGATIKDTRFRPRKMLQAGAPKADLAAIEEIVGQLPKTAN
jgi:hypothetical protein